MSKKSLTKAELWRKLESLERLLESQQQTIAAQAAVIEAQSQRIAELERHLSLDSKTSSKPPSSDGLRKYRRHGMNLLWAEGEISHRIPHI